MSTYYYKGEVFNQGQPNGHKRDGYVSAKSNKEALCKIRVEVGGFFFDTVEVMNGTSGKVIAENIYSQPIVISEGRGVWMGK